MSQNSVLFVIDTVKGVYPDRRENLKEQGRVEEEETIFRIYYMMKE